MQEITELIGALRAQGLMWKMGFANQETEALMDASYEEIPDWNADFGNIAFAIEDYWKDYRSVSATVGQPVLFFYGSHDWMVGPDHYKAIAFPKILLWPGSGGHMPFLIVSLK